jgi:hypothetical protein
MNNENIQTPEHYNQVCVWPGVIVNEISEITDFFKEMEVRVHYLETILTLPDTENGIDIPETGGRSDIFIAIHDDDVMKFAIPRMQIGIRWVEDVLSETNNPDGIIYPSRVLEYRTWEC